VKINAKTWFRIMLATMLVCLAAAVRPGEGNLYAQDLHSFENDVPFGFRMSFFKGDGDSTVCQLTITVDNKNLLFFRGRNYYEAHYETFLNMRETVTRSILKGLWDKKVRVPNYDETSLAELFDPLTVTSKAWPGKYEGFVEVKDMQANTYGNGRVSVQVPDYTSDLPQLSTPLFYDVPEQLQPGQKPDIPLAAQIPPEGSLKVPSGKPIWLVVDVYADSSALPKNWKLTAEVVKPLMLFPRIDVDLKDGLTRQRALIEVSTGTMGLGTYELDVQLRDTNNTSLARATSFKFRIVRSPDWVTKNYKNEIRYLRYLVREKEMERLQGIAEEEQATALEEFWSKIDPVPATAVNELRIQYFERIDYASKHFTTEEHEGWETNMGEVYILLGPPTEIYGSRLNQIWVYEYEGLVLHFFGHNLRNRNEFDEYIRDRRWW
jgi:GWxTD domain-containing protein